MSFQTLRKASIAARGGMKNRPGATVAKPAARHTHNSTTLQFTGTAISSIFHPTEDGKMRHFLSHVIDEASMERAMAILQEPGALETYVAKPFYHSPDYVKAVSLGARIMGKLVRSRTLSAQYDNSEEAMAKHLASLPGAVISAGTIQTVAMFDFGDTDAVLKTWANLFPVCEFANAHGSTYKPKDAKYTQRVEYRIMFMSIDNIRSRIPVHLRCPWNPKSGYLGDDAVPRFIADATTNFSKGFPVAYWFNPDARSDSLEEVLANYQPRDGVRQVVHQFVNLDGSPPFVRQELSKTDPHSGNHTWREIQLLRIEGPREPEAGKEFDPNMCSDACFHLDVRFPREIIAKALGVTRIAKFYWFMSVHDIPGIMWLQLNHKKTVEANVASPIMMTGEPCRSPFSTNPETGVMYGKASHGTLVAFVREFAPALGLYLEQNGIPVTINTAKKALPPKRDMTDVGPLSDINNTGIAVMDEWMSQSSDAALNAGRLGPIDPEVRYYALAVKVVEQTSETGVAALVPCTWTMDELAIFNGMTPEEGDKYVSMERDLRYYVYAVAPSACRTQLTKDEELVLGEDAWKGGCYPPLYPEEAEPPVVPVETEGTAAVESTESTERGKGEAGVAVEQVSASAPPPAAAPVAAKLAPASGVVSAAAAAHEEIAESSDSADEEGEDTAKSPAKQEGKRGRAVRAHPAAAPKKKTNKG